MKTTAPALGDYFRAVRDPMIEMFGEPISVYTRAQAIEDGTLIDVTELAKEAGFKIPVAVTAGVWVDCVEWSGDAWQDETGRLWDVLFMAGLAARRNRDSRNVRFGLVRIPNRPRCRVAKPVELQMHCGPGDTLDPVITIMRIDED